MPSVKPQNWKHRGSRNPISEYTPAPSTGWIKRKVISTQMNVPACEIIPSQMYPSGDFGYKRYKQNNPGNLRLKKKKVFTLREQSSCGALNSRNYWSVTPFRTLFYTFAESCHIAQESEEHIWLAGLGCMFTRDPDWQLYQGFIQRKRRSYPKQM